MNPLSVDDKGDGITSRIPLRRSRRRSLLIVSMIVLCLSVGIGCTVQRLLDQELTHRATRILETRDSRSTDYFWRAPDTLLRVMPEKDSFDWYMAAYAHSKLPAVPMPHLTSTGLHSQILWLRSIISSSARDGAAMASDSSDLALSPDGNWLVCVGQKEGENGITLQEIDTGKQHFCVDPDAPEFPGQVWTHDSSAWITAAGSDQGEFRSAHNEVLLVRTVRAPDHVQRIRVEGALGDSLLGTTADGQLLSTNSNGEHPDDKLSFCDITGSSVAVRTIDSHLPHGRSMRTVHLSPDGNFLAWITIAKPVVDPDTIPPWTHRLLGSMVLPSAEIWVSHVDGSNWVKLGSVPYHEEKCDNPTALRWLPDGKRLSFIYKKALWVVPTD